jgi:hypothetical protein
VYGLIGWGLEVCYTAAHAVVAGKGDGRLQGESYVWMFPVYGAGGLAGEAVHEALARRPVWQRALAYAATFWAIEAASGELLRRLTGDVPWGPEYREHRDQLGSGLIRLSYLPNWAIAGLALEQVAPFVRRLEVGPAASG